MSYKLLIFQACNLFQIKTATLGQSDIEKALLDMGKTKGEEVDPEQAKMLAQELAEMGKGLQNPTISDQQDIVILLRRAAKAISIKDIPLFIKTMSTLDNLLRQFAPEKFEPEFADFVLDQDTWNWVHELKKDPTLDQNKLIFLSILKDNLLYLASKPSLIG